MFCREQRSCQTKHTRALHLCQKHQSPLRSRRVAAGFSVFALVSSLHHRCVLLCPLTHSNELCINQSMQINIPRYFQCHESWVIAEFHHLSCRWQRKCLKMFGAQKAEGRENISWQRGTRLLSQKLLSWAGLIVHSMGDQHHGDGTLSSLFFGLSFYWCGTREKFMHRPWGKKEIHSEIPNSCLKAKKHLVSVPWSSSMQSKCRTMSSQSQSHIICLGSAQYGSRFILLFFFYRKFTY